MIRPFRNLSSAALPKDALYTYRQHRKPIFNYSERDLQSHFPLPSVTSTMSNEDITKYYNSCMGFSKKSFSFCFKKNRKASQWAISTWSKCTSKSYILKNGTSNDKEYVEDPGGVRSLTFAPRKRKLSGSVKHGKRQQTRISKMSRSGSK